MTSTCPNKRQEAAKLWFTSPRVYTALYCRIIVTSLKGPEGCSAIQSPGPPHVKKHVLKDKLIHFNKQPEDFNVGLTFNIVFRNRQRKSTNLHAIRPGLSRRFLGGTASCVSSPLPIPPPGGQTQNSRYTRVDNVKRTRQSDTTFLMVEYPNHIKAPWSSVTKN